MTTQDQEAMTESYEQTPTGALDDTRAPMGEHAAPLDENTAPAGEYAAPLDENTAAGEHAAPMDENRAPAGEHATPIAAEPPAAPSADPATAPEAVPTDGPRESVEPVASEPATHSGGSPESSTAEVLFAEEELADLRARWTSVQAAFVDDPKECVQKADVLVTDLVEQLTTGFADARSRLEQQWARGEQASTEDLRVALMHYREFFDRLLAV
jgi:hypothetical protein